MSSFYSSKAEVREARWFYLLASPWIIGFLVFTLGPLVASVFISFSDWNVFQAPNFIGFKNYIRLFTKDPIFYKSLYNTLYFALLSVPLNIFLSIAIAFLLNKKIHGVRFFRTVFYLPVLVPITSVAFIFYWIFNTRIGIVNKAISFFGLQGPDWINNASTIKLVIVFMAVWQIGTNLVLMLASIEGISSEMFESSSLDGATKLQQFIHITIPLISPVIFFNLITGIMSALQVFTQSYVLTDGKFIPDNAPLMMSNYLYLKGFLDTEMGYASAIGWIMFILIIIMTGFIYKSTTAYVFYEGETREHEK